MTTPRKPRAKDRTDETAPEADVEAVEAPKSSKRVQRSIYFDEELLERLRAAAFHLNAFVPEADIHNLSDIVEPAVWKHVKELEAEYNDGQPFRKVYALPRGTRGNPGPSKGRESGQ